jgi:PAS domain S-box-containing protein
MATVLSFNLRCEDENSNVILKGQLTKLATMCTTKSLNSGEQGIQGYFKSYTDAIVSNIRLAILDTKFTITWVNDKFCDITRYAPQELIGRPLMETNLVCMHAGEFRSIHEHIASGRAWSGEIRTRTKSGNWIWLKTNILPILNKHGFVGSYLILSSDITATKAAVEEKEVVMETLTQSEARYRALVDNQPDLMSLSDKNGIRIFVNEKYCEFMGKCQSDLVGTNIRELRLGGLSLDIVDKVFELTLENNEISGVLALEDGKGEKVWMSVCVRGIFDKQGKLFEILTTARDVSVLKEAEIKLSKYVEDLENIAFMTSHKVRAPIATMLGLIELLRLDEIHSDQWNTLFTSFVKCMGDLDLYTRELGAFINQRQSAPKEDA